MSSGSSTPAPFGVISPAFAEQFARDWIAAWNSHDLERILSHYDDDFEMSSPRIAMLTEERSGVLRGKDAVRRYWRSALALSPHLYFELRSVHVAPDCVIVNYQTTRGLASEVFSFGFDGRVVRASASYVGTT